MSYISLMPVILGHNASQAQVLAYGFAGGAAKALGDTIFNGFKKDTVHLTSSTVKNVSIPSMSVLFRPFTDGINFIYGQAKDVGAKLMSLFAGG